MSGGAGGGPAAPGGTRPVATVSVDLDPVDLHLVGYGFPDLPPDPLVYAAALPRLLELFAAAGIRATLFCVGRDAAAHARGLAAAVAAGHELASHTWSHPIRFQRLPGSRHRAELADSRRALEDAGGGPVVGFRAPNFDMHPKLVPRLVAAGYRYDASGYPSPILASARLVLMLKSRDKGSVLRLKPWPFTWRRAPYVWRARGAEVMEFPMAVTPVLRIPVYHTLSYYGGERGFLRRLDGFARRGEMLSYVLHGVDALGLREDRVDPRLAPHPGLSRPLAEKLALLGRVLRHLAERFDVRTYAEQVAAPAPAPAPGGPGAAVAPGGARVE